MHKLFKGWVVFNFLMAAGLFFISAEAFAASPEELLRAIDNKSKELTEINGQIQEVQKNLISTEEKGKSLNQEIKKIDYRISQLNLNIKSSELKIEKLGLEVESLDFDIDAKEKSIESKRLSIANFLQKLNEREHEGALITFMKNQSLADSIFEIQSINNLSDGLRDEIAELKAVRAELTYKLEATEGKKSDIETENKNLKGRKAIIEDQKSERQDLLYSTKNQEKLYQEQLKMLEKQQTEIAAEVEGIEIELRKKINPNLLPLPRPGVLAWPAASPFVSQGYGQTKFASRNYKGKHHNGVDIAGAIGTQIFAAESGQVVSVGNQDAYCPRAAYGKYIVIKHDDGLTTLYGHMSHTFALIGQKVNRGQLIGYMGKTGWATGSHLHFTVWSSLTYLIKPSKSCGPMPVGGDIDPLQYLEKTS